MFVVRPAQAARDLLFLPREDFGPDSRHPYLAVDLADLAPETASDLAKLPCPVIGVGEGPAGDLLDLVVPRPADGEALARNISAAPFAAMMLVQCLRASAGLALDAALTVEWLAFATVQSGPEFRGWLDGRATVRQAPQGSTPAVLSSRDGEELRITLDRPSTLNAVDVEMRDLLSQALDLALADPTIQRVVLAGSGRCFSGGGDVDEFGTASDPTRAHWVRSLRGPASRLLRLGDRLTARVQGAAIGAGLEMAAFARCVVASPDAWFQLPELQYGLIPGAGGTVSVTARVGRQKLAWMALSMRRVNARTALDWGLIDEIEG